ncbi:MAG: sterol desaturase family protein [Bacteroidota bacterium]
MEIITKDAYTIMVLSILVLFALGDVIVGSYHRGKRRKDDLMQEAVGFLQLATFIQPAIVATALFLASLLFPNHHLAFTDVSLWIALPMYLLVDDCSQYWYHRKAHEWEWLWKLHRSHHASPEMGAFASYRNAALYFVLLPNLWWGGIFTYLGFGQAVLIGLILKQIVVIGAHSSVKWDQFLYKYEWLHPVAWVVERTISTPATHFAHHGKTAKDGISDPNGNFSNMFFFWDILFGTAIITRQYPKEFGIENDPEDPWYAHLYYPIIKSKKEGSELAAGYQKQSYVTNEPVKMTLEPGKYLYCTCGLSSDNPFCNGAHHGTKNKPVFFEIKKKRRASICTCKLTKTPPYCDMSHEQMDLPSVGKEEKKTAVV